MTPPFKVTDKDGNLVGEFYTIDDAKRSLPQVRHWRLDGTRDNGWSGWIEDPAPFNSPPDYMITFVSSAKGGAVRTPGDGGGRTQQWPAGDRQNG